MMTWLGNDGRIKDISNQVEIAWLTDWLMCGVVFSFSSFPQICSVQHVINRCNLLLHPLSLSLSFPLLSHSFCLRSEIFSALVFSHKFYSVSAATQHNTTELCFKLEVKSENKQENTGEIEWNQQALRTHKKCQKCTEAYENCRCRSGKHKVLLRSRVLSWQFVVHWRTLLHRIATGSEW